jgi:hypothetical protein
LYVGGAVVLLPALILLAPWLIFVALLFRFPVGIGVLVWLKVRQDGTWSKLQDIVPAPRHLHAITYDATRQRIVLFGGGRLPDNPQSQPEYFADTWEAPQTGDGGAPGGPTAKNLKLDPTTFDLHGVVGGGDNPP